MLDNKNILITGGSGTIGKALIKQIFRNYSPKVIRIYSRDETKQHSLKKELREKRYLLRFLIGDIRDKDRLSRAMNNIDIVFHLAALKHVVACEYNPFEAVKTNVIGLQNIIDVAIQNEVEKVVFTSTDKAATPCNTMGVTKLLGEKLMTTANYYKGSSETIFYSVRFGNVLGTRGSLIPLIRDQINQNVPITLTHNKMTRYIMGVDMAIDLILKTLSLAQGGEVFVLKMDALKIIDLIEVLIENIADNQGKNVDNIEIEEIGMFAGEKLYEELFSIEESERTYEVDDMYIIFPQITEVSNKLKKEKYPNIKKFDANNPFNSKNAEHLSKKDIKRFLINNNIIMNKD